MNTIVLPIQIILLIFLLFAISRVILRLRDGSLTIGAFLFWLGIWIIAGFSIMNPSFTSYLAVRIGIQRGTDFVIYISIALIFYLIFRVNILIENVKDDIAKLNRTIALKDHKEKKKG